MGYSYQIFGAIRMYRLGAAFVGLGLVLGIAEPAWATTCSPSTATTSPIYDTTNGSKTFPGTYVGVIGSAPGDVNQIGDLCLYNGGTGGAVVNDSSNPSIYEFDWTGGILDITEEQGSNGTGSIDAELDSLSSNTATSPTAILNSITFAKDDNFTFSTLYDGSLAAGYYAIDTYYGSAGTDPNYQIDFAADPAKVPEPASLAIFGAALFGLGFIGYARRRKRVA